MPAERSTSTKRPSCHLCRLRKVKCVTDSGADRCRGCVALNRQCEVPQGRRRPGPVSRYALEALPVAASAWSECRAGPGPTTQAQRDLGRKALSATQSSSTTGAEGGEVDELRSASLPRSDWGTQAVFDELRGGGSCQWIGPHPGSRKGTADFELRTASSGRARLDDRHGRPSLGHSMHTPASHTSKAASTHIEDVIEWSTATRILHAYHAYLYPLIPVVHWPTFVQQLVSREDERNKRWRALVFSILAYSIVQLPRSALAFMDVEELVPLHQRCFAASQALQNRKLKELAVIDIGYQHIYLATLSQKHIANATLTRAIRLAQELRMHDQDPPEIEDFIEYQVRKRIFWLLYGSDRTIGILDGTPMHIWDWDVQVPYPQAVDDEFMTKAGSFPQPSNRTSVLAGFHYVSRIHHLLGAVLSTLRALQSSKPSSTPYGIPFPAPTFSPSSVFLNSLNAILEELPPELQLGQAPEYTPVGGDGKPGSDGFAICRVNILVTQALTRTAIQQYAYAMGEEDAAFHPPPRKLVLETLDAMSTESLTANGDSLRMKVLYFVLSGMRDSIGDETDSPPSEFLAMYLHLREQQQANVLLEAAQSSDDSRQESPALHEQRWNHV